MTTPTSSAALKASLSMIFTSALVVGAMASPALAAPKEKSNGRAAKPAGGGKAKAPSTVVTEDNDNDGVANNVVDAGDNRHPSGKDRSVEHGGSVNQGKSGSDPDKKTNGGLDKPGGSGGADRHDQDGNNGCGNDDDFEDDNNGNCGGKGRGRVLPKATTPKATTPKATTPKANSTVLSGNGTAPSGNSSTAPSGVGLSVPTTGGTTTGATPVPSVLGLHLERPASLSVLGADLARSADPGVRLGLRPLSTTARSASTQRISSASLPRTGTGIDGLAQLALMLLGAGGTMVVMSRRRSAVTTTG